VLFPIFVSVHMQCSFYQFFGVTLLALDVECWMLDVPWDSCCCSWRRVLANESIGMNCRTVFRFRATKAATASVSVSVAWASLSAACDLANFGDRPTQIRPVEDTGNTSAHLDSPCPHQPTWRHSVVSLFELSTVVFFCARHCALSPCPR